VALDRDGNVWFGAVNDTAVVRYDGRSFERFGTPTPNPYGFSTVFVTRQGKVWRGGRHGLDVPECWSGEAWEAPADAPNTDVLAIDEEPGGAVWFAGLETLWRFDGKHWTRHGTEQGLPSGFQTAWPRARGLACDAEGNVWLALGRPQGLAVLRKGAKRWEHLATPGPVYGMAADEGGRVWIAGAGKVFCSEELSAAGADTKRLGRAWPAADHGPALLVAHDRRGGLWVATPSGVVRCDAATGKTREFSLRSALPGAVYGVAVDKTGDAWFATERGVVRRRGMNWRAYAPASEDARVLGAACYDVAFHRSGDLILALAGGVYRFDGQSFSRCGKEQETLREAVGLVGQVAVDRRGWAWAAGYEGRGIAYFDGRRWCRVSLANTGEGAYPTRIAMDPKGNPWFFGRAQGPYGRLWPFDGKGLLETQVPGAVRVGDVAWGTGGECYLVDPRGRILRMAGGAFSVVATLSGVPHLLAVDALGRLWAADRSGRVHVWADLSVEASTISGKDGLPGGETHALVPGSQGSIWICQDGGAAEVVIGEPPPAPRTAQKAAPPEASAGQAAGKDLSPEEQALAALQKVGRFEFRDRRLRDVVEELSRAAGVKVRFAPESARPLEQRVSTILTNVTVEAALEKVLYPRSLDYEATAEGLTIVMRSHEELVRKIEERANRRSAPKK